jgi:hypothetical protein
MSMPVMLFVLATDAIIAGQIKGRQYGRKVFTDD